MGIDRLFGDPDLKDKGKWFDIDGDEAEVKLRHAGNEDYLTYLMDEMPEEAWDVFSNMNGQSIVKSEDEPNISDAKAEEAVEVIRAGFARHILVDWKHLSVEDPDLADKLDKSPGEPIGYSPERAEILFEEIPQLYTKLREVSQDETKYRKRREEQDKKN